ncbi:outer membrane protein assembly factor BamD [Ectothiorhodospiraceae bacterium BW-2]|nr:outer membrane protein assembly factor BamD [Ectothiorhodospiraceae bacterium BW-2]
MPHLARQLLLLLILLQGCATTSDDEYEGMSAEAIYTKARSELEDGAYQEAITTLNRLEANYPYGLYAQQAQLDTAFAYYKDDQPDAAIAAANRFIKLHPRHENVDYAYYLRGLAAYPLELDTFDRLTGQKKSDHDPQRIRMSFQYFDDLVRRYPNSQYRQDAVEKMVRLRNTLAEYELNVANYYFRRGAYLAAANRAQYIIENYPKTAVIEPALELMASAYQQLELDDLAKDTQRILELNRTTPAPPLPTN